MRITLLIVMSALVIAGGQARAVGDSPPQRVLTGMDWFSLRWATDAQIRPDGKMVAYVRHAFDEMSDRELRSIWIVDTSTGAERQVGTTGQYSSPRWSPDGERLAYVRSEVGAKSTQIEVYATKSGESTIVSDVQEVPRDLAWSRDGRSIAFVMLVSEPLLTLGPALPKPEGAAWADPFIVINDVNYRADGRGYLKRGYSHIFVVSASGGAARQVTSGPYSEVGSLSWSPDGADLFLSANREKGWERDPMDATGSHPRHRNIYRVSVSDGNFTAITQRFGSLQNPAISPDGLHIAYLGYDDQHLGSQNYHLTIADRNGAKSRTIADSLNRSIDSFSWSADGRRLFISYTDSGITKVACLTLDGKLEPIADHLAAGEVDLPYSGGAFTVASNDTAAYAGGSGEELPEVYISRSGKAKKLTHLNDELFNAVKIGSLTELAVTSAFDQRPISAWMLRPPHFDATRKYPLILEIHGGPYASYGPVFSMVDQLFAAAGYVVVYANPRGSTSYGEEFANLIQYHFPEHDFDDLMSVVDAAVGRGSIDSNNLFVTGASGGGALTAWTVGSTHRFRAASSRAPVIDWSSFVLTSDVYAYVARYWFKKLPWEDPDTYWRQSPISRAGNVTTPTLMIVGDQDLRVTASQAEEFYHALQLTGTPTEIAKIPGAAHGASRPSQLAGEVGAILAWFDRYKQEPAN